jgi:ornithine carbamoyltransferase
MAISHFLSLLELHKSDVERLLADAAGMKAAGRRGERELPLRGKVLGMVFEKPSLRTRVSFQAAMAQLGGSSVFLVGKEVGLGSRESLPDFARVMSQYVDAVVLRTFSHETVETFAEYATCPVVNGLSDYYHPCQALGDLLTLQEIFETVRARSLAIGCGKLGVRFILSAPDGYGFDRPFLETYRKNVPNGQVQEIGDPAEAVRSADAIYTDVWTSMGQEDESEQRRDKFAPYQVNADLMAQAPTQCRIMHCLPAHRGEEITNDVLDCERSVVFQQAGNRLHAQKALLQWLLG